MVNVIQPPDLVAFEYSEIHDAIKEEKENNVTWRAFFSSTGNLKRIALCFATAIFSQSSGNLLVSNYLTQILKDTGLKTEADITLVNGMVTLWQYIVSLAVTVLIDRFRRRKFFLVGSGGVLVTFIAWTISSQQYIERDALTGGRVVLACIFLFQLFYTMAWTNLVVTYPLEIVTYQMRAKAWAFVLLTIQVASIFGGYVNPIGLANIGWRFYIYYCIWVAIIFLVVYFFFVETQGPTLEELSYIFEGLSEKVKMTQEFETKHNISQHEGKISSIHVDAEETIERGLSS